jgi:hypothetical protein
MPRAARPGDIVVRLHGAMLSLDGGAAVSPGDDRLVIAPV